MTNPTDKEPLLRAVFARDSLQLTDNPLQFVMHELGAIVERMPHELKVDVNTAQRIIVTIHTEH